MTNWLGLSFHNIYCRLMCGPLCWELRNQPVLLFLPEFWTSWKRHGVWEAGLEKLVLLLIRLVLEGVAWSQGDDGLPNTESQDWVDDPLSHKGGWKTVTLAFTARAARAQVLCWDGSQNKGEKELQAWFLSKLTNQFTRLHPGGKVSTIQSGQEYDLVSFPTETNTGKIGSPNK